MDPAFKCFSDDQLRLSGSQLETFLNTVVFPPLCAFGIVGNTLTIMVLISNDLMSRANIFLTCLAICDVCLLILMIPHSMAHFDYFAFRLFFRYPYLRSKIHLFALANWTSAVSICTLLRYLGNPIEASFIFSFSYVFIPSLNFRWQSNSTNPSSHLLRQYVKWMRAANVALVVVIPLVFLVVLNSMLMYYVKKR
ncbi:unnamed protein product, partial [Haemonchus placei]|uniref:G_PROTEIN_RECEP_F1_2 domain-containing protein n=1 Tax=Haemonchus placei TaxID=6290 RepID=A0A0N4X5Z3_HAEPC